MDWFFRYKTRRSRPRPRKPSPCSPGPYQGLPLPAYHHAAQPPEITGMKTSCPAFQPAGYLPPPPSWNGGSAPPPYSVDQQQGPVVVNQHYYLLPAPPSDVISQRPERSEVALLDLDDGSAANLAIQVMHGAVPDSLDNGLVPWKGEVQQSAAATDHVYQRFNDVMTLIDRDGYAGNEKDLFVCNSASPSSPSSPSLAVATTTTRGLSNKPKKSQSSSKLHHELPKGQAAAGSGSAVSGSSYFAKVEIYANSRLPMNLPPLKLYIPTWPLLCLAAQYSDRVYEKPRGAEKDVHISGDHRSGTRATVIKSVPMDHMNTIVFAIRGTATFMDWAVNLNTEPTSAEGFLDDPGNYCHAGFLKAARKMIKPVATRLRQLLNEDPSRSSYSLLITGHSAGGAVAALLYSHMLSTSPEAGSELNALTGRFRRVHCVTFGAPPVSLLPLQKPEGRPELSKSLFMSFVNEGDPVARADKAYVRSLLELFAKPAPTATVTTTPAAAATEITTTKQEKPPPSSLVLATCPKQSRSSKSSSSVVSSKSGKSSRTSTKKKGHKSRHRSSSSSSTASSTTSNIAAPAPTPAQVNSDSNPTGPVWEVPPCTLSNAGRIVVLRSGDARARLRGKKTVEERLNEGVVAQVATDEQLRGVVWGNPVCHVMKLYAGRLEILAVGAVTAKGY